MFLNVLRISTSNVLKIFFQNLIVSIGCSVIILHSLKPNGSTYTLTLEDISLEKLHEVIRAGGVNRTPPLLLLTPFI